jgi:hypothetical protein
MTDGKAIDGFLVRTSAECRGLFADRIAARVGRSVEAIRSEGLRAGDFGDHTSTVTVDHEDGSTLFLRYAFAVSDETHGMIGVFSEHAGYHVLDARAVRFVERSGKKVTFKREPPGFDST